MLEFETALGLREEFKRNDVIISADQLRRWRDQGLMPRVMQVGKGKAAGSIIRYPQGTARLAIEIYRLLLVKKKLDFVGWQLWMQGYDVADAYWKPTINSALASLKHIPAWLRTMEKRNQVESETIFDQVPAAQFLNTPFAKGLAKLSPDMRAFAFGLLADVARGTFERYQATNNLEQNENRRAISKFVGQSLNPLVAGLFSSLHFEIDLERQLHGISKAMAAFHKKPFAVLAELTPQARTEFSTVLQISRQLSLSPVVYKSPVGRFTMAIDAEQIVQAQCVIVWSLFSKMGTISEPKEILEIASNLELKSAKV